MRPRGGDAGLNEATKMETPDKRKEERARDEVLAGEYVLGVLPPDARRRIEARLRADRPFAAMVSRWQKNLAEQASVPRAAPAPGLLPTVGDILPAAPRKRRDAPSLWNSLTFWRGLAIAAMATTLILLIHAGETPQNGRTGAASIAELKGTAATGQSPP